MKGFRHIYAEKIDSSQFYISVHPDVLDDFGQCHRFIIIGRYKIVFMVAFDVLESVPLHRLGGENAVRSIYFVVIVASSQADCGKGKQKINELFFHNFHFFLC